jgi:hypothetical protein
MLLLQCCYLTTVIDSLQRVTSLLVQRYCLLMSVMMTGRNAMIIMWNRESVTRSVQKTPRRITIAAVKWTLLTLVSVGRDKTKGCKVERYTCIWRRWHNILPKLPGVIGRARKASGPFESWKCLLTDKIPDKIFQIKLFNTQISMFLLPSLPPATTVMPNSQTK